MRILNLGGGIQSSAIYKLIVSGDLPPIDFAVFADTQDEPAWVYRQLDWLRDQDGPPIVQVTRGCLGDDLIASENVAGQRFASIPAFVGGGVAGSSPGMTRRQCTREYKIEIIEKWIRFEALGLVKFARIPPGVVITQLFGFSTDEPQRAVRMGIQFANRNASWECEFPLLHANIRMSRLECQDYIESCSGFTWRSSRCVYCPYQSNRLWREIKTYDIEGFERACVVDENMRREDAVCSRGLTYPLYVHRAAKPLRDCNLDAQQGELFDGECQDGCFL